MTRISAVRVVKHVTDHPRSATEVFLSLESMPPKKSLSTSQRERRRYVAAALEDLAAEGAIDVLPHPEFGNPVFASKVLDAAKLRGRVVRAVLKQASRTDASQRTSS